MQFPFAPFHHLLEKEVLGPPHSPFILEKGKGSKDFLLIAAKLF